MNENSYFWKARNDRYYEPTTDINSATVFYIEKCKENNAYLIRRGSKRGPSMYYSVYDWVRYYSGGTCSSSNYQFTFQGMQIAPSKQKAIDQLVKTNDYLAGNVFRVKIHNVEDPSYTKWYMEDSVWAVNKSGDK